MIQIDGTKSDLEEHCTWNTFQSSIAHFRKCLVATIFVIFLWINMIAWIQQFQALDFFWPHSFSCQTNSNGVQTLILESQVPEIFVSCICTRKIAKHCGFFRVHVSGKSCFDKQHYFSSSKENIWRASKIQNQAQHVFMQHLHEQRDLRIRIMTTQSTPNTSGSTLQKSGRGLTMFDFENQTMTPSKTLEADISAWFGNGPLSHGMFYEFVHAEKNNVQISYSFQARMTFAAIDTSNSP